METIAEIVRDWPVIVQGAIGAALFWVLQKLGAKCLELGSEYSSRISTGRRVVRLRNELARHQSVTGDLQNRTFAIVVLLFRAARELTKGLIWIALGLVFSTFDAVFGVIGFIGGLYYLFATSTIVSVVDSRTTSDEVIETLDKELTKLVKGRNV